MNFDKVWTYFELGCRQVDSFLSQKTGKELEIPYYCSEAKHYIQEHCLFISIAIGVLLIMMALNKLLRVLKNRVHKFESTLLGIREITHDTKVFTFSLPKGWNKKFL